MRAELADQREAGSGPVFSSCGSLWLVTRGSATSKLFFC